MIFIDEKHPEIDDAIRYVCRNLRADDRAEQFAARFDDDADKLAAEIIHDRPIALKQCVLLTDDGTPAVVVAAYIAGPGLARFHMCSTGRVGEIARQGHRWGRQRFIPAVLVPNVRRAEARILASHALARRWVAACGFIEEGLVHRLGRNGEDFVQVAWLNPDVL
jgi:hypothetical protein